MTLIVKQVPWEDDTGDSRDFQSKDGGLTSTDKSEYKQAYIVYDSAHAVVTSIQAKTATGIPIRGQSYSASYPLLIANNIKATAKGSGGFVWMVTVDYESLPFDPFQEAATTTRWSTQPNDEPVDQDNDGAPMLNAAGESFDPPLTRSYSDFIMTRSRNLNQVDFNVTPWMGLIDRVNWTTTYRGAPPKTARCINIEAEAQIAGNFQYQRVTYSVAFRFRFRKGQDGTMKELGWTGVKVNMGFRVRTATVFGSASHGVCKNKAIEDEKGMPITTPKLLSADGFDVVEDPNDMNVLEFQNYLGADLNQLDSIV